MWSPGRCGIALRKSGSKSSCILVISRMGRVVAGGRGAILTRDGGAVVVDFVGDSDSTILFLSSWIVSLSSSRVSGLFV